MPHYRYRAYNVKGKAYFSNLECPTLSEAKARLSEMGIPFVSVQEIKKVTWKRISPQIVLQFTEQLAELLQADIPLFDSLNLLKDSFHQDAFNSVLDRLCQELSQGASFSNALKIYPQYFDLLYCTLVEMGEQSGRLDEALKRLSEKLQKKQALRKKLNAALLYPCILAFFCSLVVMALIFYIVPSIESLFESSKLGLFSQSVIGICHHLKDWLFIYFALICFFALSLRLLFKLSHYKKKWDEWLLSVPGIKKYILSSSLFHWCSTVSLLLEAQVPLMDTLKLANNVLSNLLLKESMGMILDKVSEGKSLSSQLTQFVYFPAFFIRIITIGETSGELPHAFNKLSKHLDEELEKRLHQFMTLLSPLALLVMAFIIGLIMLAILIPLTDINALLS